MPLRPEDPSRASRGRLVAFAIVSAVCAAVAGAYVASAVRRTPTRSGTPDVAQVATLEAIRARPHVMFLATDGDAYRRIACAPLDDLSQRIVTDVQCQRFHFQSGRGIALGGADGSGGVVLLDEALNSVRAWPLAGVPSRARVSPDGTRAGMTFFVAGDSYASAGFSTRTYALDLVDPAAQPADLEKLALWRADTRVDAIDVNYWGITFPRQGSAFYATVATNDRRYLVRVDATAGEARVQADDVECPSLSPDGRRIAFKERIGTGSSIEWRLAVLDVAGGPERRIEPEVRSVDDQVEWLDDGHVLYALRDAGPPSTLRPDVWVVAVDGASPPGLFLKGAMSPVIVRP